MPHLYFLGNATTILWDIKHSPTSLCPFPNKVSHLQYHPAGNIMISLLIFYSSNTLSLRYT